ncbi:MAG TPA: IclR family transcriptional regulator C-terminal domain-containing protein, partial [Lentisphaeria bacterium]|nr:IclR family transcriptional regulator C-terminal domain-containing protein [Lentisphaeria bacterium]
IIALESKHPLRVGGDIGDDDRLYDTATGRMMLAMAPKEDVATVIDNLGLPGKRWSQASSKTELQKLLSTIRQDGFVLYTTSGGQVIALAVPLMLTNGPPAAIGINFPASRYANVDYRAVFGERMAATARKIESNW